MSLNRDLKNDSMKIAKLRLKVYRNDEQWIKVNGINKEFFEKENVKRIMTNITNQDIHELRIRILNQKEHSTNPNNSKDHIVKCHINNQNQNLINKYDFVENKEIVANNVATVDFIN